jgi:hypothetical protein
MSGAKFNANACKEPKPLPLENIMLHVFHSYIMGTPRDRHSILCQLQWNVAFNIDGVVCIMYGDVLMYVLFHFVDCPCSLQEPSLLSCDYVHVSDDVSCTCMLQDVVSARQQYKIFHAKTPQAV